MPVINADGCPIYVEVEGPERAPVLMLSNSLGTTLHMWDRQVTPFTRHFRLVRYDRRGHGRSGVPKGPYTMERLGRDVLAVLDGLGLSRINWCGLSMGGMVGQWLGAIVLGDAKQRRDAAREATRGVETGAGPQPGPQRTASSRRSTVQNGAEANGGGRPGSPQAR